MKTSKISSLLYGVLFIAITFSFTSCEDDTYGDPDFGKVTHLSFYITNLAGNKNLIMSPEDSPYDLDYIHIVMHDGKRVEDLKYEYGKRNTGKHHDHPAAEGYVFMSDFLGDIVYSELQSTERLPSENSMKYENKPFYLHLSPNDTDTLLVKRTFPVQAAEAVYEVYHNGKKVFPAEILAIKKQGN